MKYLTLRYKLYKVHKDIMGRIAGVPNKITSEVKEKLQLLIDELIESLEIRELRFWGKKMLSNCKNHH